MGEPRCWLTFLPVHMGIPGVFVGAQRRFMDGELPAYAVAKKNNRAHQFGLDTTRQFCLRFPFTLVEGEEPTAEALMLVNDNASSNIPEMPFPDAKKLMPQAFITAMMAYMSYNEKVKECEGISRIDLVILMDLTWSRYFAFVSILIAGCAITTKSHWNLWSRTTPTAMFLPNSPVYKLPSPAAEQRTTYGVSSTETRSRRNWWSWSKKGR